MDGRNARGMSRLLSIIILSLTTSPGTSQYLHNTWPGLAWPGLAWPRVWAGHSDNHRPWGEGRGEDWLAGWLAGYPAISLVISTPINRSSFNVALIL